MENCKDSKGLGKERFSNASMRLYCHSLRMSCVVYGCFIFTLLL